MAEWREATVWKLLWRKRASPDPGIFLEECISVRIAGVPSEIRTENLASTSLEINYYTDLIGEDH
jgi:hypothetical protein